jgi:hypothetical protein
LNSLESQSNPTSPIPLLHITSCYSVGHICAGVNAIFRELGDGHFEAFLNSLEHLLITLICHERDTQTLGTETASTAHAVQVRVGIASEIIVDGQVDLLNVDTAAKDISCDTDALVELFEFAVASNTVFLVRYGLLLMAGVSNVPVLLRQSRMHSNTWKIAFAKQLVELSAACSTLDKDDDLVKFHCVEKKVELPILLVFAQANIVLLETVQSELGIVVNEKLKRVSHEFLANWASC